MKKLTAAHEQPAAAASGPCGAPPGIMIASTDRRERRTTSSARARAPAPLPSARRQPPRRIAALPPGSLPRRAPGSSNSSVMCNFRHIRPAPIPLLPVGPTAAPSAAWHAHPPAACSSSNSERGTRANEHLLLLLPQIARSRRYTAPARRHRRARRNSARAGACSRRAGGCRRGAVRASARAAPAAPRAHTGRSGLVALALAAAAGALELAALAAHVRLGVAAGHAGRGAEVLDRLRRESSAGAAACINARAGWHRRHTAPRWHQAPPSRPASAAGIADGH